MRDGDFEEDEEADFVDTEPVTTEETDAETETETETESN